MVKKGAASATDGVRMRSGLVRQANFAKLLKQKQIGPNGRSKEWLELAQSEEMMAVLETKGSEEYIKELKSRLASKGFYKEFLE